ncbi:MAG: hypothetical protein ACK49O_06015, partial [Bacteroidota bacterium]
MKHAYSFSLRKIPALIGLIFSTFLAILPARAQILVQNNFDTVAAPLGTGWTSTALAGTMQWARATTASNSAPYTGGPFAGAGMAFYDSWNQNVPGNAVLASPAIPLSSLTPGNGVVVSFRVLRHSNSTLSTDCR